MAANIRLLRRRIKTAKNISQITKAMEMVAASKVRRAQEQVMAGKPYAVKLQQMASNLVGRIEEGQHPYLGGHQDKRGNSGGKTLLMVFATDKGLAGSLNTNLLREAIVFVKDRGDIEIVGIGKKLQRPLVRIGGVLAADFPFGTTLPVFEAVFPLSNLIVDGFMKGQYNQVICLYSQFVSMSVQKPTFLTLLPVTKVQQEEEQKSSDLAYKFEPNASELLTNLMPHVLEMSLYQILLEAYASEQAARMIAMHQASENAKDVIWELSLTYNKARQEKITNELLDISGASAGIEN